MTDLRVNWLVVWSSLFYMLDLHNSVIRGWLTRKLCEDVCLQTMQIQQARSLDKNLYSKDILRKLLSLLEGNNLWKEMNPANVPDGTDIMIRTNKTPFVYKVCV